MDKTEFSLFWTEVVKSESLTEAQVSVELTKIKKRIAYEGKIDGALKKVADRSLEKVGAAADGS